MKALIDGDVLAYRCGFAAQKTIHLVMDEFGLVDKFTKKQDALDMIADLPDNLFYDSVVEADPVEFALYSVKNQIKMICNATDADEYEVYLTGKGNFREEVAFTYGYKANRKDARKPLHHQAIRDYLIEQHDAQLIEGYEADDAMAWNQYQDKGSDTVICSIDKDLRMVPGWHFNFAKPDEGVVYVFPDEGRAWFYKQLLMGDTTDNIIGLEGVGKKTAEGLIDEVMSEGEMFDVVFEQYCLNEETHREYEALTSMGVSIDFSDFVHFRIIENGRLLWMMRNTEDVWSPPYA